MKKAGAANKTSAQQVVLITGAAGGLGQGLVAEFARQGWLVAAAYHCATPHVETGQVWPVALEVTDPRQAVQVVNQVLARWGRLDALINNAGLTADRLVAQLTEDEWDRVLNVNLKGAFHLAQAAVRPMLKQRDGHILNLASFAARAGAAGQANYAAAKAALIGLTVSLAREMGARNVRVNAVLPGVLPTPMTAPLPPQQLAAFAAANALGRLNSVEEVARFIAFLAATHHISGQVFQLDSRIGRWC